MLNSIQTLAARKEWEGILEDARLAQAGVGVEFTNLLPTLAESAKLALALLNSYEQDIQRLWGRDKPVAQPFETANLLGLCGECYPFADGTAADWAIMLSGPLKDVAYLGRVSEGLDKSMRITPAIATRLIALLQRIAA